MATGQRVLTEYRAPLTSRATRVLALTYFGGHTQREAAVLTGVSLGTVKSRTFAAVQRLRALLTDQWGSDGLIAETNMVREVN